MSDSASNTGNPLQIEIFPRRILTPETAQELLNELYRIDGVIRVMIQGPRLPEKVAYGPGTGEKVEHPLRKAIQIENQLVELKISVGRIRLELADAAAKEKAREVCDKVLPFPYEFREGHFFRRKATVTDYAKHGPGADPKILGMCDPKAKKEEITFIEKDE